MIMAAHFRYRADVLPELERHGVRPTPHTSPELVRGYVRDLYKYEIRTLRGRYLRGNSRSTSTRIGSINFASDMRCSLCCRTS